MVAWKTFAAEAPRISSIFVRRHAATGNLCFLGTLRADGYPRISPLEPQFFDSELVLVGMPDTLKFRDLERDPRFTLHTASVDTQVSDGDAKVTGLARNVHDEDMRRRFAENLFDKTEIDLRTGPFPFFTADLTSAGSLEVAGDHLEITVWKPGQGEQVVTKT